MGRPSPEYLLDMYAKLVTFPVLYPILCYINDAEGGSGYYYGVPQMLLPKNQRPHSKKTAWPGIIDADSLSL